MQKDEAYTVDPASLSDTQHPIYLGYAPITESSLTIGSRVVISLVFDEIIGSTSPGITIETPLSDTPFTLGGGLGTNVLYFEGTVTNTVSSPYFSLAINGHYYDLCNNGI